METANPTTTLDTTESTEQASDRPIFIVGVMHSGTTILYGMLGYHANVGWFSQYSQRDGHIPQRPWMPGAALLNAVLGRQKWYTWKKENTIKNILLPTPREPHKIWDYALPAATDTLTPELKSRIQDIVHSETVRWGGCRLVIKLPRLSEKVSLLAEALPDAQFVHIVRDGRAVAVSNRNKFDSLDASMKHWIDVTNMLRSAETQLGAKRFLTVRYEDLCADTHGVLKEVLAFLGLDAESSLFARTPQTLHNTNDRQLATISPEELTRLSTEEQELLQHYGYTQ